MTVEQALESTLAPIKQGIFLPAAIAVLIVLVCNLPDSEIRSLLIAKKFDEFGRRKLLQLVSSWFGVLVSFTIVYWWATESISAGASSASIGTLGQVDIFAGIGLTVVPCIVSALLTWSESQNTKFEYSPGLFKESSEDELVRKTSFWQRMWELGGHPEVCISLLMAGLVYDCFGEDWIRGEPNSIFALAFFAASYYCRYVVSRIWLGSEIKKRSTIVSTKSKFWQTIFELLQEISLFVLMIISFWCLTIVIILLA